MKGDYGPMDKYLLNSSILFNDHIKALQELSTPNNLIWLACLLDIEHLSEYCEQFEIYSHIFPSIFLSRLPGYACQINLTTTLCHALTVSLLALWQVKFSKQSPNA